MRQLPRIARHTGGMGTGTDMAEMDHTVVMEPMAAEVTVVEVTAAEATAVAAVAVAIDSATEDRTCGHGWLLSAARRWAPLVVWRTSSA